MDAVWAWAILESAVLLVMLVGAALTVGLARLTWRASRGAGLGLWASWCERHRR